MKTVNDIIDWPIEFGPIDAEIECRPVDAKIVSKAMLPNSVAILAVNDAGIWIRSATYRQGTHAHCPAAVFPEFECSTAGAVVVYPSSVSTLRFATLSADAEHVSVSLHGERLTMEANEFGGTVPTVIPERDAGRHQNIADLDLRSIHDRHTAEVRIVDWKFEDFLELRADVPDSELTLSPDKTRVTTQYSDSQWRWKESTGSGEATYPGQEFLEVFDRFYPIKTLPRVVWGDNEPVAMIFRRDGWHTIGYVIPVRDSSPDRSETAERRCPTCGSQLEQEPSTGNWACQAPKCGFRSVKLE